MPDAPTLPTEFSERNRLSTLSSSSRYEYESDFINAISSRFRRGIAESTGGVLFDFLSHPSRDDEPKLSVSELYQKFDGVHWKEPLTERQAQWRWRHAKSAQLADSDIQQREQGFVATSLGVTTELLTSTLASPETYVAPFVGRMTSAAAKSISTASSMSSSARALALSDTRRYFLAGFAEDALLTATITEPLYASRQEMIDQPYRASDYMANVLLSGTLSGVFNSGISHTLDRVAFNQELSHNSRVFAELLTGNPDASLTPQQQRMILKETKFARTIGRWKAEKNFQGRILVEHLPEDDFVSGMRRLPNGNTSIVVNTAKLRNESDLVEAMENAMTRSSGNRFPKVEMTDKGSVALADLTIPEEQVISQAPSPHTQYNLSNPKPGLVETSELRLRDEAASGWDLDPTEVSTNYLNSVYSNVDPAASFRVPPIVETAPTTPTSETGESLTKALDDQLSKIAASERAVFGERLAGLSDPDVFADTDVVNQLLSGTGYTKRDFVGASQAEIEATLTKVYTDNVTNRMHNAVRQNEADELWASRAAHGKAEVHEFLDGSIESGVTDRTGHGNNVWRAMESERSRYSNILHTALIESDLERFLTRYDDQAQKFFQDLERFLLGDTSVDPSVKRFAKVYETVAENQRTRLNMNGAGVRKLKGFFLRTTHNADKVKISRTRWEQFMMDNMDWERMGRGADGPRDRRNYLNAVYEDIINGHPRTTDLDIETQGGYKGKTFANARSIHFKPGSQTLYNDLFGRSNTARELFDQVELRAKAIAITDSLGPDFKSTWKSIERSLSERGASPVEVQNLKNHFDEITGEANIVVDQHIAAFGQGWRNFVQASTLHGTGITVALSDPAMQVAHLRASGLSKSMGQATRRVWDSYRDAVRAVLKNNPTEAERRLSILSLPHDTNLQAARNILGDNSYSLNQRSLGGWMERLSQATIKWSGTGIFTKLSQMSTAIATQRSLAHALRSGELDDELLTFLKRFDIGQKDLDIAGRYIVDDQLDIFSIESNSTRNKFHRLLSESISVGSLQTDPRQTALFHGVPTWLGLSAKKGTIQRELSDSVTQFLPAALAVHQKVLMRMAIMGGGDARFRSLLSRSRIAETVTLAGMMLGSAVAITTTKDILKNKTPAFAGEKPLDPEYMYRVLKVAGIVPLMTEFMDTIQGGMLGQQGTQIFKATSATLSGDPWEAFHQTKKLSPFVATNIGPMPELIESLVGMVSDEYLRDTLRRHRTIREMSGQDRIIK